MTFVRLKGLQVFRDRHGKMRCYHRKSKAAVDLSKYPFGFAEFLAECARIAALTNASGKPRPGTLGEYRANAAFQDLAPRTQRDYQRCFDYLQPMGDTSLARFD